MGMGSWWHWAIVIAVVLILFGGKKIPELMKGVGTGIKGFKKAIKDDDEEYASSDEEQPQKQIAQSQATKAQTAGQRRPKSSANKSSRANQSAKSPAKTSVQDSADTPKKRGRPKKA